MDDSLDWSWLNAEGLSRLYLIEEITYNRTDLYLAQLLAFANVIAELINQSEPNFCTEIRYTISPALLLCRLIAISPWIESVNPQLLLWAALRLRYHSDMAGNRYSRKR
jgi:hypothetical protein